MRKYRGSRLVRFGCVGLVLIFLVVMAGLNFARFTMWLTTVPYRADFTESAGLAAGAPVLVSGVRVGAVSDVSLVDGKARVVFTVDQDTRVGDTTSVQIRTGSLLGQRIVTVEPSGQGVLGPDDVIPTDRTSSPYSLNDAVNELTTNTSGIDTAALNTSLDTLSATVTDVAPDLGPMFDGLAEISRGLNARNGSLRELLATTSAVTDVIAGRANRVNTLILNSNLLLDELVQRRRAIASLLANTAAVADQLTKLVADNEEQLAPTLDRLNSVAAMLERNRDNIAQALPGLAKVSQTQGEAVSGGPFYQAYVANLIPGPLLQPFIDQAFGITPQSRLPIPGAGG
ncbi:MCE family protein [Gordonia sp. HNM0687]|uniref:MCE family protein n=1 Tax=Gordonia mangrovi TaxID=2665643 RepID=A0A6L7GUX1_9ACTN|nr:MCE family protein [Gordonia mangrovi]MXP23302.1 MCE family protein [Gordonia mangrovi]UVF76782.1 MCE family protein [Gordonia mangrovi]